MHDDVVGCHETCFRVHLGDPVRDSHFPIRRIQRYIIFLRRPTGNAMLALLAVTNGEVDGDQ